MSKVKYIFKCSIGSTDSLYFSTLKDAQQYIAAASVAVQVDPTKFSVALNRVDSRYSIYDSCPWEVQNACNYSFERWLEFGQPKTPDAAREAAEAAREASEASEVAEAA